MGWVNNRRVDINWDVSPVSYLVTVLSHRSKFQLTCPVYVINEPGTEQLGISFWYIFILFL